MTSPLAIVTGANRGIGLETCRQLARKGFRVLLGSRDPAAGERAARTLQAEGLAVDPATLDVSSKDSIARFAKGLTDGKQAVHVLVNNAGVSLDGFNADVAARTLATNYFGAEDLTDAVLPVTERGGRIVLVSSGMGDLSAFGADVRARFLAKDLDRAGLDALVREFLEGVRRGDYERKGWPSNAYRVSKAAMNALARILAPELARRGIAVNAVCPGWVRSDMGGSSAPRSLERGAEGVVWAATLPPDGPTGGFFRDGKAIAL